jgi:hypothetical protein
MNTMQAPISMFPIIIFQSRYGGAYEGGDWFAVEQCDDPTQTLLGAHSDDENCAAWFADNDYAVGVGATPNEAYAMLLAKSVMRTKPTAE